MTDTLLTHPCPDFTKALYAWNDAEAERFRALTPEYLPCEENVLILAAFFAANGACRVFSCAMLQQAFRILSAAGLLIARPVGLDWSTAVPLDYDQQFLKSLGIVPYDTEAPIEQY